MSVDVVTEKQFESDIHTNNKHLYSQDFYFYLYSS